MTIELCGNVEGVSVPSDEQLEQRLPSWRAMHADTSPSVEQIQLQFFRKAPAWRKLEMAGELRKTMLQFVRSELMERYPNATPSQIRRLTVERIYGSELAEKAYGQISLPDDAGKMT